MEVITGLNNLKSGSKCAVTIGTFDGLHLGHQKIIENVLQIAEEKSLCSTLITFDPHPKIVIKQSDNFHIEILSTLNEKLDLLEKIGLDRVIVIKFDMKFAEQTYEQFVKNVLIEKVGSEAVIVGHDHAFGKNREGHFENLQVLSKEFNFYLKRIDPVLIDGETISSSLIRKTLSNGDVEEVKKYLGRYYYFSGTVVPGYSRGKQLNFPTANIYNSNPNKHVPKTGVYAVDVLYDGNIYKGMLNIGYRPTFGLKGEYTIEVHIINFNKDIYNENITVFFKKRLRNEIKFDSKDALIKQLEIDKQNSLKL